MKANLSVVTTIIQLQYLLLFGAILFVASASYASSASDEAVKRARITLVKSIQVDNHFLSSSSETLVFVNDDSAISFSGTSIPLQIYTLKSGNRKILFRDSTESAGAVAYCPSHHLLVAGFTDGRIMSFNTISGKRVRVYHQFFQEIKTLSVSPMGDWIVAPDSVRRNAWVLSVHDHTVKILPQTGFITSVNFFQHGALLAVATTKQIQVYETQNWHIVKKIYPEKTSMFLTLAVSLYSDTLIASDNNQHIYVWKEKTSNPKQDIKNSLYSVKLMSISANDEYLATVSAEKSDVIKKPLGSTRAVSSSSVSIYDLQSWAIFAQITSKGSINDIALAQSNDVIAIASDDGYIRLFKVTNL